MTTFTGEVNSDFMKLVTIPENKKIDYIDYAATDFYSIKTALVEYIKAVYPNDYKNFSESDLGIMLLEMVAYMGAVMSMKADMLANENTLATAKQRDSVRKLFELIGVSLRGPIASAANAKITLSTPPNILDPFVTINPQNRIIVISSPEDNAPLNYTLYKVTNGLLDDVLYGGNVQLPLSSADNPLPGGYTVYTNIAILEGALVTQSGTFSNSNSTRKISLTESPVIDGSVQVFINAPNNLPASGSWSIVDNLFYASGSTANVYQVVYDDNYAATVVFGDGIISQSPPIGATYFIIYRLGGGTRGNIGESVINAQITIINNGNSISTTLENISIATGGSDAETIEHAKKYGPLIFKQQNRLVTLEDYAAFVNRFGSSTGRTGKATPATRKAFGSANIIDLYVLEKASNVQLQKASPTYKKELLDQINNLKMITDEIVVVDGLIRTLDLVITIRVDKELSAKEEVISRKVSDKILNFFNVDNRSFGQALILGDLNREIFIIPEVRYSTVDNLVDNIFVEFNEIIQLNNFTINVELI